MTTDMIRVEPSRERRRCFAGWAVAQSPKIRTVDYNAFAVPADLFTRAPESILIGALVDGIPYVPVQDDEKAPASADDGFREAVPGEPLPPVPESAYGPDAVPLDFAPLDDAPTGGEDEGEGSDRSDSGDEDQAPADGYPCDLCDRTFTTVRGRRTHRRQTHAKRRS